jgi:lipopolysaccharide/colanic/teichoic acid biosynthesis glycosyltransferase
VLLETISPAQAHSKDLVARRSIPPVRTRTRERRATRVHVLSEAIFRSELIRERRRADRFNEPFMLLRVEVRGPRSVDSSAVQPAIIEAVSAAKEDTDILGWLEHGTAIGLLLPEIGRPRVAPVRTIERRVRGELAARLGAADRRRISVQLHAHAQPADAGDAAAAPLTPVLDGLSRTESSRVNELAKRALDILGSLALLLVLSPIFLVIAALIKLKSPGPVFYRQTRIGRHAKPFTMFKFRTMFMNADHGIHHQYVSWFISSSGKQGTQTSDTVFKLSNDPRVTPIGRLLRATSLDELPQFLNVLRGEMSLVGPRPPLPYELEQYKPWHCRRVLEAKPGITGLWQVTGRSRTTFDDMVRLDLRYVRTCSLWTDIKILLATPRAVISGKGAC